MEDINLDIQYADDISLITTNESVLRKTKETLPKVLKERDLKVNINKTEEHVIHRNGNENNANF